ncbi:MAG: polysaccharide deacetylase family protein, partial [Bacteroidales bacterium]
DTAFTPEHSTFKEQIILFPFIKTEGLLPFDIFSASVYLLSRYEEYGQIPKDNLGRFSAKQSLAYKLSVLSKPIVNLWALELKKELEKQFPQLVFSLPSYQCFPTLDVDQVYAFKHKPLYIQIGAFVKDVVHTLFHPHQANMLPYRWRFYMQKKEDPFNNLLQWTHFFVENNLRARFFILMGKYGGVDKSNPSQIPAFCDTIRELNQSKNISVGIHFSLKSNYKVELQKKELAALQQSLGAPIQSNRQHYLILNFPQTYQNLIAQGITEDFTMGYADLPGFRAGIATPFPYFDLSKNEKTSLTIFPFAFMDGTYREYMQCDYAHTLASMKKLVDEIRGVGGTFICLFHNESLANTPPWEGWKELYTNLIHYAK